MATQTIVSEALIRLGIDRQGFKETEADIRRLNEAMKKAAMAQSTVTARPPLTPKHILGEGRAQYQIGETQARYVTKFGQETQAVKQLTSWVRTYDGELKKIVETYRILNREGKALTKPKLLDVQATAGGKTPFSKMTEEYYRVQAGIGSFKGNFSSLLAGGDKKTMDDLTRQSLAQFKIQAGKIFSSSMLLNQQLPTGEIVNQQVTTYFDNTSKSIKEATVTYAEGKKGLQALGAEVRNTAAGAKQAQTPFAEMGRIIKRAAETVPVWMAIRMVMTSVMEAVQSGIQFWKEFESAMAEVQIVGKGTKIEFEDLGKMLLTFSTVLGISASKSLEAAKIFAQQGLSIQETIAMTRIAMLGSLVLGKDVKEMAEDLTAGIRAYNIPMTESISLLDEWMQVQKEFAVTSKDLSESMKTAGATAAALNISKEAFIGHVTSIIEVTRKSGSEAGNALQMIYSRLLTQGKNVIQTVARVPVYLDAQGKATFTVSERLRNQSDVLYDVAKAWETLTSSEKEQLAVQIGSRRQLTPFMALMDNFKRGLDAEAAALNSAGASLKAYEIQSQTTQFKITQMQNSWLQLAQSVQQTDAWKTGIMILNEFAGTLAMLINYETWLANVMKEASEQDTLKTQSIIAQAKAYDYLQRKIQDATSAGDKDKTKRYQDVLNKMGKPPMTAEQAEQAQRVKQLANERIQEKEQRSFLNRFSSIRNAIIKWGFTPLPVNLVKSIGGAIDFYSGKRGGGDKSAQEQRVAAENRNKLDTDNLLAKKEYNDILAKDQEEAQQTEQQTVALIDHRANMLKLLGATEKQILQFKIQQYEASSNLIGNDARQLQMDKMRYETEAEITKEKLHQVDLVDESVQLYKLAQKYGPRTAEDIANYMRRGNIQDILGDEGTSPNRLGRIMQEFFPQMSEQFKMKKYFETGRGTSIPIQERAALGQASIYESQQRLENFRYNKWPVQDVFNQGFQALPPMQPPPQVTVNVRLGEKEIVDKTIETIITSLNTPKTMVHEAVKLIAKSESMTTFDTR